MPKLHIYPAPDVSTELPAGTRGPASPELAHRQEAVVSCEVRNWSGQLSKIRDGKIVGREEGEIFHFYHRCLGPAEGRFKDVIEARRWAMTYGYLMD